MESLAKAAALISDVSVPLDERVRAMYDVKAQREAHPEAVLDTLYGCIDPTTDSVLLQHEVLYNIGQVKSDRSLPILMEVVKAKAKYNEVARHEALESVGAIGSESARDFLVSVRDDAEDSAPVRESAELALARMDLEKEIGHEALLNLIRCNPQYVSVDPAPQFAESMTVQELEATLMDPKETLFRRYRAMFSLRNWSPKDSVGLNAAVAALCRALRDDQTSCLFRHEVAFVLGQMEHPSSADALAASLADRKEHGMVRHESAEALGALAKTESLAILREFVEDEDKLVRDSCVVALDMHRYWSQFNKADGANVNEEGEEEGQ